MPINVRASSWTSGQAAWAKHGFRHGQWDRPSARAAPRRGAPGDEHAGREGGRGGRGEGGRGRESARGDGGRSDGGRGRGGFGGGGGFDGAWVVSAGGACAAAGTSRVVILGDRVSGPNVTGTVSPSGAVRTVGVFNGMSIVSSGRIANGVASGTYQQSDGCGGNWSAFRS